MCECEGKVNRRKRREGELGECLVRGDALEAGSLARLSRRMTMMMLR